MLVRAAGRRTRRNTCLPLTQLADSLYLPFLCPAQLRWNTTHSQQASAVRASSRLQSQPEKTQTRRLATTADQFSISSDSSQYPFPKEGAENVPWNYSGAEPFTLKPHDPLFLSHSTTKPQSVARWKYGIGGSTSDLVQNLHTCLRVGRFERARLVIQRLGSQCHPQSFEIQHAHRIYLESYWEHLQTSVKSVEGKLNAYESMRDWFEGEVVEKQIPIEISLLIPMIRAAINALKGGKRDRAVRRYAELARLSGEGTLDQIRDAEDFSDAEFMALGAIFPDIDVSMRPSLHVPVPVPEATQEDVSSLQHSGSDDYVMKPRTDMPKVLEVSQKGMGLNSLKQALEAAAPTFNAGISTNGDNNPLTPVERQRVLEESASQAAIMRWKLEEEHLNKLGIHTSLEAKPLGALMWQWYAALLPSLREELNECRKLFASDELKKNADDRLVYGAHLESVPIEQVAATTIIYIMSFLANGKDRQTGKYTSDMRLGRLTANLGRTMEEESNAEAAKKRAAAERRAKSGRPALKTTTTDPDHDLNNIRWPNDVRVKLGAMLISKLIDSAKLPITRQHPRTKEMVTQLQPAFQHKTLYELGRRQGWLCASPDLIQKVHREPTANLIVKGLPMVIEPKPWTHFAKGGYLNYPTPVIRFNGGDSVPRDYAYAAIQRGDLDQVFAALNALSKVPWQINDDVLRVQLDAWNSGEPVANFAPLDPKVDLPQEPTDKSDISARRKWLAEAKHAENVKSGFHSQRCFQNFQLEIARAFRNEKMYFPHNIDFRGRAYPIPPYLNHMGADNARALMKFANGKELGVDGLRWLKIHLANVFGYDKASLQEREQFAMEHLPDIHDSATNPLTGNKWWLQSEDAWQTLAACFELKAALDLPDPTKYISTLPIHQDGTCNGLQHYAALGGDAAGARQVNLEPGDRPSDVYTAVAEAVKAEVERDCNEGHPVAKILHGKITRKVVKQPVMTNVYGVTYYGAREQVKKQIEEIFPDIRRYDSIDHTTLASYVANKIFKSLGEMFKGAQAIQQWLGACADRISTSVTPEQIEDLRVEVEQGKAAAPVKSPKSGVSGVSKKKSARERDSYQKASVSKQLFRSSVIWTTPLRLPVVQPYRSSKRRLVSTNLQKIALQEPTALDPVSRRKQLQGFPPNFIHSLDATHMMLSALKCNENNISFASIHDSFWTHACDVTDLSRVLRDAFVAMHTEDVVGRLREEFKARYKDCMYLASVDKRSHVGKKMLQHQRDRPRLLPKRDGTTRQPAVVTDLLQETERLRLLNSEDPEERQKGEEMVTSGSIFEAEANAEDAITLPNEVVDARLGEIPDYDVAAAKEKDASASELVEPVLPENDEIDEEHMEGAEVVDEAKADTTIPNVEDLKMKKKKPTKPPVRKIYVWLPMKFPVVPEKGTFDVTRLKESQYFFH